MNTTTTIKILIIDDHQVIVDGLRSVIMRDPRMVVVGSAPSLARGLALLQELRPQVTLLDIRLADASGISVVEKVREAAPNQVLIVLTGFGMGLKEDALRAGANAFLSKEFASDKILRTIKQHLLLGDESSEGAEALSSREREIAGLAASGKTNPEIAELLGVSVNTVKTHLSNIMAKLGVSGRVAMALEWEKAGRANHSNG